MYKVKCDNIIIYDDTSSSEDQHLINPVLEMEDSTAGSFKMTVPIGNRGYSSIQRMTSDITIIKRDTNGQDKEIWWGRVLSEEKDFWNNRVLTCEGALAFLNDVCQPLNDTSGTFIPVYNYLATLFNTYNAGASLSRQIHLGIIEGNNPDLYVADYVTNFEPTIDWVRKVAENLKFHLLIRKTNGVFYLDFLKGYLPRLNQTIQFGENLLDFTKKWKSEDYATVVIPLGAKNGLTDGHDMDTRLTIADYQATEYHSDNSIYIVDQTAVNAYGRIEKVVTFDDIEDSEDSTTHASQVAQLYGRGLQYLQDYQFDTVELEVTAVDLSYLNANANSFELLHKVQAISSPHSMNHEFPITKISIPLDQPENAKFTLGDSMSTPLTSVNGQLNQAFQQQIRNLPSTRGILEAAQQRASEVMNRLTVGYVTLHEAVDEWGQPAGYVDAIYISDAPNMEYAQHLWKWDMNGFGYTNHKEYNEETGQMEWKWDVAITMEGEIVADFITTGSLSADLIRNGTLLGRDIVLNQCMTDTYGHFLTEGGRIIFQKEISGGGYVNEGGLYYDNNGAGMYDSSQNRIVLESTDALKLRSGTGMSLEAWTGLYLYSYQGEAQINGKTDARLTAETGDIYLTTGFGHNAYLNGSEIITASNIYNYIPSSSTAVFG